MRHRPEQTQCEDRSPGLPSLLCTLPLGHSGKHAATWFWPAEPFADDAPTLRIPPVRDSIGPRRRPPSPVVAELSERLELLRALVDELAADDEDDQQ